MSDPFFWRFLVISELGSRIYIVKSAILIFWVFLPIFLHEITLQAIDIDNIGCLEPFLPLWEHFWNRVSVQLNCASDLTPRHKYIRTFSSLDWDCLEHQISALFLLLHQSHHCTCIIRGREISENFTFFTQKPRKKNWVTRSTVHLQRRVGRRGQSGSGFEINIFFQPLGRGGEGRLLNVGFNYYRG